MLLKRERTQQHKWHWLQREVQALTYRAPMPVICVRLLKKGDSYPVCPRCDSSLDREGVGYCDRCGQRLGWGVFCFAVPWKWVK